MSLLGISTTSEYVCVAHATFSDGQFAILDTNRIAFDPLDWASLYQSVETYLKARIKAGGTISRVTIAKRPSGKYSASPEAFKAEAIVELVMQNTNLTVKFVSPQALKKCLKCEVAEKWQQRAKEKFNPDGKIKNFSSGLDGAVTAAFEGT